MDKKEALKQFKENYVDKICIEEFEALKEYCKNNKDKMVQDFVLSLRGICLKIKDMQDKNEKGKIAYITFSMLRTEILEGNYVYLIEAFNNQWFLDETECTGEYNASWAFNYLGELKEKLKDKKIEYAGQIRDPDIEKMILNEAEKFNIIVEQFIKYSMTDEEALKEINSINKDENFEIRVGEYMDISEEVYSEGKSE